MDDGTGKIAGLAPDAVLAALDGGVLDLLPAGVAVFGPHGSLEGCNATWLRYAERYTGLSAERFALGPVLEDVLPDTEPWNEVIRECIESGGAVSRTALPLTGADGSVGYYDFFFAPVVREGALTSLVQVISDVSEREAAMRTLERTVEDRTGELQRRREVAEGLHEILSILNSCCPTDEVMDYIIGQAKQLLGSDAVAVYRLEHSVGGIMTVGSHGITDDLILDIAFPTNEGFVADTLMKRVPLVCPDSTMLFGPITDRMQPEHRDRIHAVFTRFRALLAVPLVMGDKVWGGLAMYYPEPRPFSAEEIGLASDLADHLALAIENAELRENAEETAALAERNRLARELHDAVTQTLFSASLVAEVLPKLWERDREDGLRRLDQLRHLTRGALAEMRTLLLELRPAALVDAELGDVLRQLGEAAASSGIDVQVFVEGTPRKLPPDLQVALYRAAQESLNNISKHAGASRVELALRYLPGMLELSVDDNGTGFDPHAVTGDHFGLKMMRERAESVGARLHVESAPGLGTCVSVTVETKDGACCA